MIIFYINPNMDGIRSLAKEIRNCIAFEFFTEYLWSLLRVVF